jgi:hypothetical protein
MRCWIWRRRSLFIELIQSQTENEDENEDENEKNENENDENEDKQYRIKLSINIKTNDDKSEDVLNRLHFMKFESWKKTFLSRRKVFFFSRDANSIRRIACSNRSKREDFIWFD